MINKKSAFDVLMNKVNKQKDDTNQNANSNTTKLKDQKKSSNLTVNHNNDEEKDIILLANESNVGSSDIEIITDDNSSTSSSKTKTPNLKTEQIVNFYNHPLHVQHTHQYTESDQKFLENMNQNDQLWTKLKLKEESDDLSTDKYQLKFDSKLEFDFTKYKSKFELCTCKTDNDFESYLTKDITFSINNSFENTNNTINDTVTEEKTESSLIINKTIDSLNDTLNDATTLDLSPSSSYLLDSSLSSSSRGKHSKRRKVESKSNKIKTVEVKETDSKSSNSKDLLWTEKYQFKNEDDIVTNNSQFDRLKEWLTSWKTILSKTSDNNTKKSYGDGDESDSDYSYESDYSNADSVSSANSIVNGRKFYSNAILLSGPHGCGKTSSIYSVAKQLGFKVFEVNASSLRCKTQIIQELEGAMNSHHVSNEKGSSNTNKMSKFETSKEETNNFKMEKFFKSVGFDAKPPSGSNKTSNKSKTTGISKKSQSTQKTISNENIKTKNPKKRKNSLRREVVLSTASNRLLNDSKSIVELSSDSNNEDENSDLKNENLPDSLQSSTKIHRESLILFDEIDVVFREDVGFWAAINHFIKRSKKPIVLTTSDDFLQDKINLNIEKIEFIRPRIDASVRFLKSVARSESTRLDTATAYKIIRECKCDMRRALSQLQALISSSDRSQSSLSLIKKYKSIAVNSTLNISKFLTKSLFSNCKLHNENLFYENILYLDQLTLQILKYLHLESSYHFNSEQPASFKKFDIFLLKDGLTDNSSSSVAFNPFLYQQTNETRSKEDLTKLNTTFLKENLLDFYNNFIDLFNQQKLIDFTDWCNFGRVNEFNFASNVSINRLAQSLLKFTSNLSLCLEYRPFLQKICWFEELKQTSSTNKRRYLHYLTHLNLGLNKEDFSLLSKSSLTDKEESYEQKEPINNEKVINIGPNLIFDAQIFSND